MTAQIEKVQQELNKVFSLQNQLQKEVWNKENYQINSMKEDMLSDWAESLGKILNDLQESNEDFDYIGLNER
jgi:hypothetical protein